MEVLCHHIYEYKKGLRNLVLHTINAKFRQQAEQKLRKQDIPFLIREVTTNKINIFFGAQNCIDVIRQIGPKPLNFYTPEEDFILGIMLGYDRLQQCTRYVEWKKKHHMNSNEAERVNQGYEKIKRVL